MEDMKKRRIYCIILLYLTITTTSLTDCDARSSMHLPRGSTSKSTTSTTTTSKKFRVTKHFNLASLILQRETMDASNTQPYVSSPFTLPPYESLSPYPLPENSPPYCTYPPNTPQTQTPPTTIPFPPPPFYYLPPVLPNPSPPSVPNPPQTVPTPTISIPSPPYYEPTPPTGSIPSPPIGFVPSPPTGFGPGPPTFLPPIVFPPPTVPPPPKVNPTQALWCVAKPSVPDPIIQEAMNYACGSGADCDSIQPSGSCFEPDTIFAHASYAFNSYWQRTKVAGGSCSFGGTAILVTVDPSYDGCHFLYF
ncbi:hypothetical protein K2173_001308 [Erythroxylum novogranatense]|uniref:X8 domain-containing protein n=1 Tax=Erythroxylum novogranatense TaxID=1862640 RepID=A0AAV8T3K4_9ROSI|nr:hypothetical protein K2173_001308 [Erythroxylum novogranatense]